MHATEVFGQYARAFQHTTLPDPVIHHAKRAVIDWHASLFPGLATAPLAQLEQVLADDLDRGPARLGNGRAATAQAAALYNGAAAHAAEVDDSFREAMYHPGAATIAAALAAGQQAGASGLVFLRALVLGYEVSTRIGVVMGRPHYRFWHNTGTVGAFGAAAAASGVLQLDAAPFAHALATAATFASGLQQAFRMDSMSKPLHAGRAAEAGLLAAQLAGQRVTGSLDVLDGEAGLGRAMSDGPDWSHAGDTLGRDFHITRLTFKNHIGCGHTFAAIDGALALRAAHKLQPADIRHVQVATYGPALDIACYENPQTENEARFSLRFVVATALVHGSVRLAAYTPERLADPALRAMVGRIGAVVDPEIDAAFPGRRSARVEIETHDGRRLVWLQPDRKGDPELPLSDEELEGKFLELAAPVIGAGRAQRLLGHLWALDRAPDLHGLAA
ncbi:MmgE/PrpD family protein [Acidovorax sp. SUPP2522]|uniref:MmgE/PrpD family protein n=1 Tax=unclassified Acidovorax TaxID=2684926 RepID=UPI0023491507|nr:MULTISPECIES: MmgE/PrpD family protein [unclassified Acidovorax]WCN00019.1 MmgE/PrpD family protein [Acidovorax sp. GBBC 1281]GKT19097.1 MmgE/PrpD family protein [Acidovorax sp. SUPP2522]